MTRAEVLASSRAATEAAQQGGVPLTPEEAMARALKYNLNAQTRRIEQAIALDVWQAGKFDLLPRALASAAIARATAI